MVTISIAAPDLATANLWAGDLESGLREELPGVPVHRERTDDLAQDFGATLVVILSAPAMIKLADGAAKWLARRSEAKLTLQRTDGDGRKLEVQVQGRFGSDQVEQLLREFFS